MCSPVPMKMMGLLVAATLSGNSKEQRQHDTDSKQHRKNNTNTTLDGLTRSELLLL